jgi:hypothetical protein
MARLKTIVSTLCLLIIAFLIAAYFTGRTSRSYEVMPFDAPIEVGDTTLSTLEFATNYQPLVFLNPKNESQPILWTWYEIIETSTSYDIVYYTCWENEVNPKKSFDVIYKIFRYVYFGYPLYDIEYLMVKVNKSTADIETILFETSIDTNYNQDIVRHYVNTLNRVTDTTFVSTVNDKAGEELKKTTLVLDTTDAKVHLGIQTWNHMLCPITDDNRPVYTTLNNAGDLKPLTASDYKTYKFSRKSQSAHKTESGIWSLVILTIGILSGFHLLLTHLFFRRTNIL